MKKLFSLILCLFLIASFVDATRFVNYNLREGKIDINGNFIATDIPVNNVNVVGYVCLDEGCKTLGKKIFIKQVREDGDLTLGDGILNSGLNSEIQLFYPSQLLSNFGYAVYYYKNGFIPWEANPNWFGTTENDPQGPFNVYLTKKDFCTSKITEFNIQNSERVNTPVVFNVKADVDSKTKAAISHAGPLGAVPEELKEHYSIKTLVTLDIINEDGINVYSDEQQVLIGFGNEENIKFEFIPGDSGNYNVLLGTRVTDEKCSLSQNDFVEKEITILEKNPLEMCYTDIGNLELSSFNVRAGHNLLIKLDKVSNFQKDIQNEVIIPVKSLINAELLNEFGETVYTELFKLEANTNSKDVEKFALSFTVPEFIEQGNYELRLTGESDDERCSLENKKDVITERIFVEKRSIFGNAPQIISKPIRTAALDSNYIYDVEAVDADNDVLKYKLLSGPEGMIIDQNTGLITWHVDVEKFKVGERHFVLLIVGDGLFLDAQFFFITINGDVIEKKEKREHDFRVRGMDLEFSDTENGIVGFLSLKNDGDFKENNVNIYADIYELGLHEVLTSNINLGTRDSIWVPIDMQVPSSTKEREYLVNVIIENSKYREEHKFIVFIENKNKDLVRVITRA